MVNDNSNKNTNKSGTGFSGNVPTEFVGNIENSTPEEVAASSDTSAGVCKLNIGQDVGAGRANQPSGFAEVLGPLRDHIRVLK